MDERAELEQLRALDSAGGDRAELERLRALDAGKPESGYSALDLLAPWESALHTGSAMLGGIAGGLRGIVSGGDQEAMKESSDFLTYQPRGKLAQQIGGIQDKILSVPAQIADYAGGEVTDKTGSPALGTAANLAVQAIPSLIGGKGAAAMRSGAAESAAANSVKNASIRKAAAADYRMPPSEMVQGDVAKSLVRQLESFGGKEALQQDASTMNQKTILRDVRKDIGLDGEGQITKEELDAAKEPHFKVYEEAGNISPRAKAAKEAWRQANYEAKRQEIYYKKSGNPAAEDAADAAKAQAQQQMATIESEAVNAGMQDLVDKLRASRVALGKIGTVEKAWNDTTGEVSASSLLAAKKAGAPLQGGMKQAADVSKLFKNKLTQSGLVQPGVSKLDAAAAAAVAIAKGDPRLLAYTGLPAITRRVLLSKPVQSMAAPPKTIPQISSEAQLRTAALIAALQKQQEQE